MIEEYQIDFESLMNRNSSQPEFLRRVRNEAFARFAELGFPSTKMEDWRFTNVSPIAKTRFQLPDGTPGKLNQKALIPYRFEDSQPAIIFNGRLIAPTSGRSEFNNTVTITSLSQAIRNRPDLIESHLTPGVSNQDQAFVAWNTAFIEDGLVIQIPPDQVIESPIHLIFASAPGAENIIFHQRNLVLLGPNSQATIIEHYLGLDGHPYFTNSVTEINADDGAVLHYIRLQDESEKAYHLSYLDIHQKSDSQVSVHHLATGGRLNRNDVKVLLDGEGCSSTLNGLVLSKANQHMDNHTILEHVQPNCTSREFYKHILTDRSQGVFNGLVVVKPNAIKTDANQLNKNLLLSKNAIMNSNPQLEIHADDVKCSHGSTTGELDEDAIFYLRSRGIDMTSAQLLLIRGFAGEILEQFPTPIIKNKLNRVLQNWLVKQVGLS